MHLILPTATGEKYEIVKQLRKMNVLVAGWEQVDIFQLRDMLARELEIHEEVEKPKMPVARRKEIGKILKDYRDYLAIRKSGARKFY